MFTTLISASELNGILDQEHLVIIDARHSATDIESGRKAYQSAHIPNALFAHLDEDLSGEIIKGKTGRHPFPPIEKIVKKLSDWGIDMHSQVVVYDASHGGIAARLWFMLKWLGHDKVAVLNGGFKYWTSQNFPTDAIVRTPKPSSFKANLRPELIVDVQFMEANIDTPELIYIDARAAKRYRGEEEPLDPIAGHIPSAISAPFTENIGKDGLFLDKQALIKRFVKLLENQPKGNTIFYCGSGVTACHNLLVMHHLGITSPKLYPGSWSEWIVDKNREVVVETPS